jgi:hypothetical protein
MTETCRRCHTAIALGLNYPEEAHLVYWQVVFREVVPWKPGATEEQDRQEYEEEVIPRIKAFMEASEERQAFLEKKVQQQLEYFEAEKKHYGYKTARRILKRYF